MIKWRLNFLKPQRNLKSKKKYKFSSIFLEIFQICFNYTKLSFMNRILLYQSYHNNLKFPEVFISIKKKNFLNKLRNFFFNHFDWTEICWREKKFTKFARNQVFQIFMKHLFKRLSHIYSGLFNLFSFDEMGQKMLRINTY